eukprot:scaffold36156_cov176-Amphora_coffeaeformis.AAC.2
MSTTCVSAFTTTTTSSRPSSFRPTSTLHAVHTAALSSTAKKSNNNKDPATQRPTDSEQKEFLQKAVELRRVLSIQKDLALTGKAATTLQYAQATGYGDDLTAYEQALEDGYLAREALVTRNMGLVYYCVNEIMGKRKLQTLSREDLIQEGAIGLARAVDKWNPAIGGKFSTYAVYWVRAFVLRCLAERDDLVRVPEHVSLAVGKMTKAAAQLGVNIDGDNLLTSVYSSSKEASWKEAKAAKTLAEQAGLTEAQLAQAIKVRERRNKGMTSFETWMQKGRDFESDVGSVLEAATSSTATSEESMQTKEILRQELSRFLRPREMEALSWRYGLLTADAPKKASTSTSNKKSKKNYLVRAEEELFGASKSNTGGRWGEALSFNEVGERMQVSAEYGRRLCHAALTKLRRAAEDGNLSPSLLTM